MTHGTSIEKRGAEAKNNNQKQEDTTMKLIRWNQEPVMSDFINRFFENDYEPFLSRRCGQMPATNVIENEDGFVVELAVPGMKKEDFKVSVENNMLTISSEKEVKHEEQKENYTRREFSYGAFSRSFTLPRLVDAEKISAAYTDGILKLNIPKKEEAKASLRRNIEIG